MRSCDLRGRAASRATIAVLVAAWVAFLIPALGRPGWCSVPAGTIVVGSKNFPENRLLAEIFAQLIETRTDLHVERRLGLAGTKVAFDALRAGAIDLYPEYTGTGLVSILGMRPEKSERETLMTVRREFLARWNLWWIAPLGFENSYELAVPEALARADRLVSLSDLARVAPRLRAGFGYEFVQRPDGLPGLEKAYGMHFASVRTMQQALKYQAVTAGRIDVLDVYTTDGRLLTHHLRVLRDDKAFFPHYGAAALVRGATLRRFPEIGPVLALLSGSFDARTMQKLNLRVQEEEEPVTKVARAALVELGLVSAPRGAIEPERAPRRRGHGNLFAYMWHQRGALAKRLLEHLELTGTALALGVLFAVPLGVILERQRRIAETVIRAVGVTQTLPSIALLAFMIPFFGIGVLPAIIALWIYSLFPILRGTYSGIRDASPDAVDAALALGMTKAQALWRIRLPLAAPAIMAGIRTAAVITVGTATLAAFIGAGGLGQPIVTGLQLADTTIILSGAIPAAALAICVDLSLGAVEGWLRPPGAKAS